MPNIYFTASFGGVPLLISSVSTERGRDVAVSSPEQGDEHTLTDRGKRLRRTSCEILFVDQAGRDPYTERYEEFLRLAEGAESQVFTHPLDGSYRAKAEGLSVSAAADSLSITVSCTFVRDAELQTVFPIAAGGSITAGPEAVAVAVTETNTALAASGLTSSAPGAALVAVTAWAEAAELDSQEVFLDVANVAAQIDTAITQLELAADLKHWSAYEQLVLLRYQVVRAAELFTSDTERLMDVLVQVPRPLLAICAEIYGGAEAQDRADEAAKRNRIRAPGRIPAGTTLKMAIPRAT